MIYAAYNGVPMRSIGETKYRRDLILSEDGVQAYGVRVNFQGVFAVNSGLMGSNDFTRPLAEPELEGAGLVVPDGRLSPAELLLLVQLRLEQPRKPLVLWTYVGTGNKPNKVVFLRSPIRLADGSYAHSDIAEGPIPVVNWTDFDTGQGSVLVGFACTTDIALPAQTTAHPVLSNRWEMQVELDPDFYAVHEIEGRAVFRRDVMEAQRVTPDMLRPWFVHPIPLGFRRHGCTVRLESAGTAVRYSFQDVEQPADQPGVAAYGASRVEIVHQREHTGPSPYNFITPS